MEESRASVCSLSLFYSSLLQLTGPLVIVGLLLGAPVDVALILLLGTPVDVALLIIGLATLLGCWTGMPLGFS